MKPSEYALIPTFVAIVEEKNYTRAAKKLGVSQSAVSQSVNKLRELFDDVLFIRNRHGVEITQYAQDIYPSLSRAIKDIALSLPRNQRFDPATCNKEFTISGLSVLNNSFLPKVMQYLSEHAPMVKLCVLPLEMEEVAHKLRLQEFDFVLEGDLGQHNQLQSAKLLDEQLCVVCRPDHPRLTGDAITQEMYLSEKHIAYTHQHVSENYFSDRDLGMIKTLEERNVVLRVSNAVDLVNMAKSTDCIALAPRKALSAILDQYQLAILEPDFLKEPIPVSLFWHPSRNNEPHHRWFREVCQTIAQDIY
ncbi:LysR family transcriptional regulator [Vibrio maerlii]|uniref:LysR family transcriptional regulator n=1 Tax=Vibrio maerlii TaxID=2231648 RepID=UPI000E3BA4EC|nr:LysR family transcriptional regulator [Vibrio maerlii]